MYRLLALYKEQVLALEIPEEEGFLGSAADNDLVLPIRGISRRHALIRRRPGGVEVIDLGSKNGLFVEGEKVDRTTLTPGLHVQVGEAWLELQEASTSESAPGTDASHHWKATVSSNTETTSIHVTVPSTQPQVDALQLALHMDLLGAGTPGQRDELLARLRGALGATLLLSCERQRREKIFTIREGSGGTLSEEETSWLNTILLEEPRGSLRDEVRLKRFGVFLIAGRGDLFLVARFVDDLSARKEWRKVYLRLLAERLLGAPTAMNDAKADAIHQTLALTGGNKSETARLLKVSRQTVYNFLKRSS